MVLGLGIHWQLFTSAGGATFTSAGGATFASAEGATFTSAGCVDTGFIDCVTRTPAGGGAFTSAGGGSSWDSNSPSAKCSHCIIRRMRQKNHISFSKLHARVCAKCRNAAVDKAMSTSQARVLSAMSRCHFNK